MNALQNALLLMSALGGGDPKEKEPARDRFALLAEPLADLDRRIGRPIDEDSDKDPGEKPGTQDETAPQRPQEPPAVPAESRGPRPILDFDWLEIQPRVGMAIFSKDYHVDPSVCFGVVAHAPLTLLSPSWNPDGEYFGLFAKLDVAIIKRDIFPKLDKPGGPIFMFAVGGDYTVYRSENWLLMVEGGIQYCHYGGITDLQNGIAPVVGVKIGLTISRAVSLSLTPEYILCDSNHIIMGWLSVMIEW
jgi:hypothetical protein